MYSCQNQQHGGFPAFVGVSNPSPATSFQGISDFYISCFDGGSARQWATYYGGSGEEQCFAIGQSQATGVRQEIYVAGYSSSPISELAAPQGGNGSQFSQSTGVGFIGSFHKVTGLPLWRTKIDGTATGGKGILPTAMHVHSGSGNLYLVGCVDEDVPFSTTTTAGSFPLKQVAGRYFQSSALYGTSFIMEFALNGNSLQWSTVVGSRTRFNAVRRRNTDAPGLFQIMVSGSTNGANFTPPAPTTPIIAPSANNVIPFVQAPAGSGSATYFQPYGTGTEGLLLTFDEQYRIDWCTLFGGFGQEAVYDIGGDGANAWVAGSTNTTVSNNSDAANTSGDFPVYSGIYNHSLPTYGGGYSDDFIAAFSLSHRLVFSRYFGGTGDEGYLGDPTVSLQSLDRRPRIAVDGNGNVVLAGTTLKPSATTNAPNFPLLPKVGMHSQASNGSAGENYQGHDAYFAVFRNDYALSYSQYYGGGAGSLGCGHEWVTGIGLIQNHRIYAMLSSCSGNTPISFATLTTTTPWQRPNNQGGYDAFVMYLDYSQNLLSVKEKAFAPDGAGILYPNPATARATIELSSPQRDDLTIRLADATGRTVRTWSERLSAGVNKLSVDVAPLAPGLYFLHPSGKQPYAPVKLIKN